MRNYLLFFSIIFLLTGCGQQTSFVNVNLNDNNNDSGSRLVNNASSSDQETEIRNRKLVPDLYRGLEIGINQENQALENPIRQKIEIPVGFDLKVPFASQAPLLNWDADHKEACEEASMILAAKYFKEEPLSNVVMEEEIQKLIQWENDNGYKVDVNAEETAEILKNYFGLRARLVSEVTADRIKYEISRGRLIIAPAAGRLLGNPYYQTPGPIYHMLLIRGYDEKNFITNDVGTKRGEAFKYKYNTLINSIHDWNHALADGGMTDQEMVTGRKVIIVIDGVNNK